MAGETLSTEEVYLIVGGGSGGGGGGSTTTNLSAGDVTTDSGKTYFHPNLIIDTGHTFTIEGSMHITDTLTVNGTLVVNGDVLVIA